MAQFEIIVDEADLSKLFTGQGLSGLVEQVLNQVLAHQVTAALKAQPGERTQERVGYRNGTREREMQTRIGTITLKVPRTREGEFSPDLWERYQRSEQAFVLALCEMVLQGVSTRKVEAITEVLCGAAFSKSQVSKLCLVLDPLVKTWRERPLGVFPFILVDAIVVKIREDGRVRQCALLIACGIDEAGYRHVLGFALGDKESETSWSEFFTSLKVRGLTGVEFVISDDHAGLVKAIGGSFAGATWQRCQAHFIRNLSDACPKTEVEAFLGSAKQVLHAPDLASARTRLRETCQTFEKRCSKAVALLESAFDEVTSVLILPTKYHRLLRTSNSQERLNEEIRRRDRVIRIYPNRASCERLLGALLMEFDEAMTTGKVYTNMDEYHTWRLERSEEHASREVLPETKPSAAAFKGKESEVLLTVA
ncbi:IS256 family transposase [Armatimonas sp.]|uniref:IS256 family transposase n=1 Tax=Armatimonas sp. TaxID=1872638 RepID=UPI00286D3502|nr:IS256 family transposase [Armatimonas sp.]